MLFTLHRYIFRELLKVFFLTSIGLTLILSLCSVLAPVQEYGVGPEQILHLIVYFLPITLTFVLPMAALFAVSLIYGRFAADNELNACRASGISLMTLIYPGLILAIAVAIANLLLSFYVMPAFVKRAEESIKADAKQIVFRNIERNGYYKLPPEEKYRLYADNVTPEKNSLTGVVITEIEDNKISRIISAEAARVNFIPHKRFNEVQITAYNTFQMGNQHQEGGFSVKKLMITHEFDALLADDIKFKKIDEMKRIAADPLEFYPIEKIARKIYSRYTAELLAEDIRQTISKPQNNFYNLYSGSRFVDIKADKCYVGKNKQIELVGNVIIIESDYNKKPKRTLKAPRAVLHLEGNSLQPTITLQAYDSVWQRIDGSEGLAGFQKIRGLVVPPDVEEKIGGRGLNAISPKKIKSSLETEPSSKLKSLLKRIRREISDTLVEIEAEKHFRLVFGLGCVPMIMIALGLGIIKNSGHMLSAFGISLIPAAVLVNCLMMGKNVAKNSGVESLSGIALMWAGLAFLVILMMFLYRKLLKN